MSSFIDQKTNGLSPVERLKVTDKYLAELEGVLSSMDEIASLRAKNGQPASDEVGGYKRSSVVNMIAELKKQKNAILDEIDKNERAAAKRIAEERRAAEESKKQAVQNAAAVAKREAEKTAAEVARKEAEKAASALAAKSEQTALSPKDSAIESFRKGDPSLAIEGMYTGLSMDIEKMRDDILQEMKYTYKQDMAIYDDLSEKIAAITPIDMAALEERLKPLQALAALAERLDNLQPINYDELAAKVAEKVTPENIDYDELARRVASVMAANEAAVGSMQLNAVEKKIDSVQNTLSGAVSVKQLPEFKKLDSLIAEYLRTLSYDHIPDILVTADAIKNIANRYILSGNALRGETMLSDLRMRLTRVNVWGATALTAVDDAIRSSNLPVLYSEEAFAAFRDACREFEQSSAVADDELAERVARSKNVLFNDADQHIMDRDTLSELMALGEELAGAAPDEQQVKDLTQLKKELMSFNLSGFIDLVPAVPEEGQAAASSVDTETILDAIRHINVTVTAPSAEAPVAAAPLTESAKLAELSKRKPSVAVGKQKVLRPAVSAKDNKTEKTDQPLRTVRRSIKINDENPDSLSKKLVEELALKIANSRVR